MTDKKNINCYIIVQFVFDKKKAFGKVKVYILENN